jgi:hypothetical protein
MAPRMEILDSEDEGSEFSPVKAAFNGSPSHINSDALEAENPVQPRAKPQEDTAITASSLKSTDPSFFQRVYKEQRAAAAAASNISYPGSAPEADMSLSQPPLQPKGSSSLTPITDPGTATRKSKRSKDAPKKDVIDLTLTQVTTPRKEVASREVDPWDVPSSPETKLASHELKTYGRRKRTNQQSKSSQPGPNLYDFPSTADPSPAQATQRMRGMQSPLPTLGAYSSPVMLIPQTEENASSGRKSSRKKRSSSRSMGFDSLIPDTGLYIAPSALTASQKQQYEVVALSSDPRQDTLEPALPVLPTGDLQLQKSSMATTIAYSTPSRFASSGKRTEIPSTADPNALPSTADLDALPSTARPEVSPAPAPEHEPSSSPDVISEEPRRVKRGPPQEPPLETRSAKKRKSAEYQHNQPNIEDGNHTVSDDTPGIRRGLRRKGVQQLKEDDKLQPSPLDHSIDDHLPDLSPQENVSAFDPDADRDFNLAPPDNNEKLDGPTQAPKKRRGRGKKEPVPTEDAEKSIQEDDPVAVSEAAIAEDAEPPTKKRRGRPRKSTVPEPDPPVESRNDVDTETPAPPVSTAKQKRRGRKKNEEAHKSAEHVPEEEEQVEPEPEPIPALAELSQNSRPSSVPKSVINASDDDDDGYDDDIKENELAKKPATTPPKVETVEEKKEVKKAVSLSNQAAPPKVPYRVGLSKKSRIAPLLKSIRK